MQLFETSQQEIVEFTPSDMVTIYACGITPDNLTHVGHMATFLTYDVLQRRLRDLGHETRCVRNITDIPIASRLARARELGTEYHELAGRVMEQFGYDCDALRILPVYKEVGMMSLVSDIVRHIDTLLERGHAYYADGFVFFAVDSCEWFGSLRHLSPSEMLRAMTESDDTFDRPSRQGPLDFVLWQPSEPEEPEWPSPWGLGRPGWHIQCATLAILELGETIDVHGGGEELVVPHHECEASVAQALTGQSFVRHWMHSGNVMYAGQKMSKSLGNLVVISELLKLWDPAAIRLVLLSRHYREAWPWDADLLPVAANRLESWRRAGSGDGALDQVREALDHDLDTPSALTAIDQAAIAGQGVSSAANLLGVAV